MTLVGHLSELRKRLIFCLIPFAAIAIISFPFARVIISFLRFPSAGLISKLAYFSPQEVALVYTKTAVFCGLVLSLPVFFYHAWRFISPALDEEQKTHITAFIFWASVSFLTGALFGYLCLLPFSLRFLLSLGGEELTPVISISRYISFVLAMVLGSGAIFEIPILVWILTKLRIINAGFLKRKRKYAVAAIFILAALITPTTDPFNMCLMALPMLILFEISVWIAGWNQKEKN